MNSTDQWKVIKVWVRISFPIPVKCLSDIADARAWSSPKVSYAARLVSQMYVAVLASTHVGL